ncbi:cytochrome P450 4c3-like [Lycorma delicatula]|uniref:cytochrome P450 4c3-like n=1 Tax=Lycorma delicatula TaxID=130591 RepID=UPI003F50FFB5
MLIIFLWCLSVLIKWVNQRRHFLKLASLLPGPPTVPILGNLLMIATRPQEVIGIVKEWNYTYNRGPFRVWLCHKLAVILSKPSDIEAILGNVKQFSKSQQYDVLRSLMGDGLFTSKNHNSWKSNRKLVTPAFHFTILKGFLSIFYQEASILADKINSRVGECTDVYPYVALCTLDAICRTAMGVSVKAQHGNGGDFVKNLETVFKLALEEENAYKMQVSYNAPVEK